MKKVLFLLAMAFTQTMWATVGLTLDDMRVNGVVNPVGIGEEQPVFSWHVADGDLKGVKQTSFRVQVFTDSRCTKKVWDSRSQMSHESNILGPALIGVGTKYYWKVTATDNKGRTIISKPAWFVTGLNESGWGGAKWLKGEELKWDNQNGATVVRHPISIDKKKKLMYVRVFAAALGEFDLFVNGQRVGREGDEEIVYDELKAGVTDLRKQVPYMTFDITEMVEKGDNMLGAQMSNGWWSGDIARDLSKGKGLGFMAKVYVMYNDSTLDSLVTNESWEANNCGPLLYGDIYNGETYDGRKNYSWATVGDTSTGWSPATIREDYAGEVVAFYGPTINVRKQYEQTFKKITVYQGTKDNGKKFGEIDVKQTYEPLALAKTGFTLHAGETALIDLGQNIVGWPYLNVKGSEGTEITCRMAEMLNDDGSEEHANDGPAGSAYFQNLRSAKATMKYIMNGNALGETYHPSSSFFGFRYISLTATQDITIMDVKGQVVGSDIAEYATFECSNPEINQLYSNVRWGMRGNMLSIPTDCPQRDERLGWTGDTQIFARTACYNANMQAFYRKWMRDLVNCQSDEGAFPDTAPLGKFGGWGNAAWADAGIIVPWTCYLMYGDTDILEENYEAMERYMLWLQGNTDDTYLYNGAGIDYGDWLAYEPMDKRYIAVCYYAYCADLMARISIALGKEEEPDQYNALAQEIRKEFRQRFVKDDQLTVTTQTAYVLALHFNMLEGEAQYNNAKEALKQKIVDNGNKLSTGFVGTAYLLPTLSEYGMSDLAYTLLLQHENPSWLYSVDQGATTIWERWNSFNTVDGFKSGENMNSFNHYSYGVVAEWMFRDMAGMNPDHEDPGFHHIYLDPKVDDRMDWMKASIMTPYGKLTSEWEKDKKTGKMKYHFIIPYNCTATFLQPKADGTKEEVTLECGKWNIDIK